MSVLFLGSKNVGSWLCMSSKGMMLAEHWLHISSQRHTAFLVLVCWLLSFQVGPWLGFVSVFLMKRVKKDDIQQ